MKPSCKLFRNLGTFYLSQLLWMNNVLISPYHVTHSKYRQRKMLEPNNEQRWLPVVYISAEQRPNSIITWIDWILPKCRGKIYNENFCTCYFCLGEEGASVCSVMIQSGITFGTVETKSLVSTLLLPSIIQMRLFISPHPAGGIPKPKCLLLKLLMCSVQFWKLAWILLET